MKVDRLDHVAVRVADRAALTGFLTTHLGMHVIQETERFTLVGADAALGKLALFDAEQPRRGAGALGRISLAVRDLDEALALLPAELPVERGAAGAAFAAPDGLPLGLVARRERDSDYDVDRVMLRARHPLPATNALRHLGFDTEDHRVVAGDAVIEFVGGEHADPAAPYLDHLGLLVSSADGHLEEARARGLEVDDVMDTENARSVFVVGPEGLRLEYLERKASFSLS